jgi:RHS repeat-associated protein
MEIPAGETAAGTYRVNWNGHGDALNLWRIETDGTLTLANTYTYTAWGSPTTYTWNSIPDLGFRFLYVGEWDVQWDNIHGLGLAYMHARHYSPALGRFLQPDPTAAEANLYAYTASNPVTRSDPTGTLWPIAIPVVVCLADPICAAGVGVAFMAAWNWLIRPNIPPISPPRICLWGCGTTIHFKFSMRIGTLSSFKSAGAAQKAIERGQAPPGIERVDKRKTGIPGSQDEVHVNGGSIKRNGDIKHTLDKPLNGAQKDWLRKWGFQVPRIYR